MPHSIVLFNGVVVSDSPPGQVGRYKSRRPGSWQSARLLLYMFPSFPRLWIHDSSGGARRDADVPTFQYRWTSWVSSVNAMHKDRGAWALLAAHMASAGIRLSHRDVTDVAKATIEFALRDAETERNSYSSRPRCLAVFWPLGATNSTHIQEEQVFMGKVRRAISNNERAIERCIYHALASHDGSIIHRISRGAPASCVVNSMLSRI